MRRNTLTKLTGINNNTGQYSSVIYKRNIKDTPINTHKKLFTFKSPVGTNYLCSCAFERVLYQKVHLV